MSKCKRKRESEKKRFKLYDDKPFQKIREYALKENGIFFSFNLRLFPLLFNSEVKIDAIPQNYGRD